MTLRRLITLLTFAAMLAGPMLGSALAGLAITPAYVVLELDKGRPAGTFLIRNTGNSEERFRINAVHFDISERGAYSIKSPTPDQLGAWIKFNPKELVLPAKTERKVRFVVAPRSKVAPGEYRAAMELESLKVNKSTAEVEGRTLHLNTMTSILVPIFAHSGELSYSAEPKGVQMTSENGKSEIRGAIQNTGSANLIVEARYVIEDMSGNVVDEGKLGRNHVLPGNLRIFSGPVPDLDSGKYKLRVDFLVDKIETDLSEDTVVNWKM